MLGVLSLKRHPGGLHLTEEEAKHRAGSQSSVGRRGSCAGSMAQGPCSWPRTNPREKGGWGAPGRVTVPEVQDGSHGEAQRPRAGRLGQEAPPRGPRPARWSRATVGSPCPASSFSNVAAHTARPALATLPRTLRPRTGPGGVGKLRPGALTGSDLYRACASLSLSLQRRGPPGDPRPWAQGEGGGAPPGPQTLPAL